MTPQEETALAKIGLVINENQLVAIFMSFCYGIYILIFPVAVTSLVRKGLGRTANMAMFVLALVTFLSTTLFWSMYIAQYVNAIKGNLLRNFDIPIADRAKAVENRAIMIKMVILWPQLINFMIGDAIVVWRVWSLYGERTYIRIALVVLWVLTAISYTLYTGWRQHLMNMTGTGAFDPVAEKLQVICFSLSCGTNIIGTALVGLKAWEYRRVIKTLTGGKGNPTIVQRCLDLLTESGVLYCALQFTFLILNALNDNKPSGGSFDIATHVMVEAAIIVGAIYPLLTIILVSQSRSISDTTGISGLGSGQRTAVMPGNEYQLGGQQSVPSMQFGQNSAVYLGRDTVLSAQTGTLGTTKEEAKGHWA